MWVSEDNPKDLLPERGGGQEVVGLLLVLVLVLVASANESLHGHHPRLKFAEILLFDRRSERRITPIASSLPWCLPRILWSLGLGASEGAMSPILKCGGAVLLQAVTTVQVGQQARLSCMILQK